MHSALLFVSEVGFHKESHQCSAEVWKFLFEYSICGIIINCMSYDARCDLWLGSVWERMQLRSNRACKIYVD